MYINQCKKNLFYQILRALKVLYGTKQVEKKSNYV
jgi:hypothetical protein